MELAVVFEPLQVSEPTAGLPGTWAPLVSGGREGVQAMSQEPLSATHSRVMAVKGCGRRQRQRVDGYPVRWLLPLFLFCFFLAMNLIVPFSVYLFLFI